MDGNEPSPNSSHLLLPLSEALFAGSLGQCTCWCFYYSLQSTTCFITRYMCLKLHLRSGAVTTQSASGPGTLRDAWEVWVWPWTWVGSHCFLGKSTFFIRAAGTLWKHLPPFRTALGCLFSRPFWKEVPDPGGSLHTDRWPPFPNLRAVARGTSCSAQASEGLDITPTYHFIDSNPMITFAI